ncbi:MAG: MaoC/PaaZ C-terminal domain-containing protein [Pseudomonadales bacterium]|jgi:acyl dehydratase|nr:MaoC/PaaZ C-terminal domain-containing protein [Pseudomonadales bacterium]MDP6472339.1 MaoC/PaaZ C-terminal domain-containing protein [Pseudomonadales bacterium]MDP6828135.1 MaoC/PaaZ C-terminal domain-containing protein [Pseudomonadales bacterium]MDP6971833.1 MaoC/PaaZ C-terminal domain-containing protein [Pseudomonadales bacterium]|tara:strand:+ start:1229 stop:1639 length:411 start_codon:yes stop_codon:yes gene_type:complete
MTISRIEDVQFGEELPVFDPDTSLDNVKRFAVAAGWNRPRFTDHEAARAEGLPGALVPGIMSQGFLAAMIHRWAPDAEVQLVDTVFRAPVVVDLQYHINGVVTDIDEEEKLIEIDLTLTNDADETRVFGTAKVLIG